MSSIRSSLGEDDRGEVAARRTCLTSSARLPRVHGGREPGVALGLLALARGGGKGPDGVASGATPQAHQERRQGTALRADGARRSKTQ